METRIVTLGTLKTGKEARKALETSGRYVHHPPGNEISPWNPSTDILDNITYSPDERQVEVRIASGENLGLEDNHTLDDVLLLSKPNLDIALEAGVIKAINYIDQPAHSCIVVASKPKADRNGNLWLLTLVVSSIGPLLWTHHCPPNMRWPKSTLWLIAT